MVPTYMHAVLTCMANTTSGHTQPTCLPEQVEVFVNWSGEVSRPNA
jgi:hypothetical protein